MNKVKKKHKPFYVKSRRRNARYAEWRDRIKELSYSGGVEYNLFEELSGKYVIVGDARFCFKNFSLTPDKTKASSYIMPVFSAFLEDFGCKGKFRPIRSIK